MSEVNTKRERVIVAGDGEIAFGMGVENNVKLPFIMINELSEPNEVGTDVLGGESKEILTILFKNLKSLEVLEKMCSETRKYLERLSVLLILGLTLTSCKQSGRPSSSTIEGEDYKVEFLFEKDGVKVYRFKDDFKYHYFTSKGETMTSQRSGKTSHEENIY